MRDKKGFTMVEMVVALTLLSIIIALSSVIFLSSSNAFGRAAAMDSGKQLGEAVYDHVSEALTYAVKAEIVESGGGEYDKGIKIEDGKLYIRPDKGEPFTDFYSDEIYGGRTLALQLRRDGDLVRLTVVVSKEEKPLFTKSSAFRMLNVEAALGGDVSGPEGVLLENPKIYYQ